MNYTEKFPQYNVEVKKSKLQNNKTKDMGC